MTVTVVTRGSDEDTDLDFLREEGVSQPTPMQHASGDSIADQIFELRPEMLAPIPRIVREATQRVGFPDGHVDSIVLRRNFAMGGTGEIEFEADVVSRRRHGRVRFDASGRLVDAQVF